MAPLVRPLGICPVICGWCYADENEVVVVRWDNAKSVKDVCEKHYRDYAKASKKANFDTLPIDYC